MHFSANVLNDYKQKFNTLRGNKLCRFTGSLILKAFDYSSNLIFSLLKCLTSLDKSANDYKLTCYSCCYPPFFRPKTSKICLVFAFKRVIPTGLKRSQTHSCVIERRHSQVD